MQSGERPQKRKPGRPLGSKDKKQRTRRKNGSGKRKAATPVHTTASNVQNLLQRAAVNGRRQQTRFLKRTLATAAKAAAAAAAEATKLATAIVHDTTAEFENSERRWRRTVQHIRRQQPSGQAVAAVRAKLKGAQAAPSRPRRGYWHPWHLQRQRRQQRQQRRQRQRPQHLRRFRPRRRLGSGDRNGAFRGSPSRRPGCRGPVRPCPGGPCPGRRRPGHWARPGCRGQHAQQNESAPSHRCTSASWPTAGWRRSGLRTSYQPDVPPPALSSPR